MLFHIIYKIFIRAVYRFQQFITYSGTGPVGLLMNVVSTAAFVLPAASLYKRCKTRRTAVVGLLVGSGAASARVVEDGYEMRIVSAAGESVWRLGPEAVGATFSAIAVAPGTRADERGMRWELDDHPMGLLGDLGVSNVVESPDALVACREGALAAYLLRRAGSPGSAATKTPQ